MGGLLAKEDPKDALRRYKRVLDRSIREIDRERLNLERQEKKVTADIKKTAREGQIGAVKIMAKDLVRTRKFIEKFYGMRTQLQSVSLRLQAMRSTQAMADAMKGAAKVMYKMNAAMDVPGLQKIMMEFEKQSEVMELKEEVMNDAVDGALDEVGDADAEEEIIRKTLDEIGVDLDQKMPAAPQAVAAAASAEPRSDLESRFENLRK